MSIIDKVRQFGFGYVHHRFLNDRAAMKALRTHLGRRPGLHDLAEGDVCWVQNGKAAIPFLWHPNAPAVPRLETVQRMIDEGEIMTLEGALDEFDEIDLIIELKGGRGDHRKAIETIVSILERRRPGRYWLDSFSLRFLTYAKQANRSTVTSFHTRSVAGSLVLETAMGAIPCAVHRIETLHDVDIVTATYKYSFARFLGGAPTTIDRVHVGLQVAGKYLVMGGVVNEGALAKVMESAAIACYPKFGKEKFMTPGREDVP